MLFAFFDGDNIGNTLEILLIEERIPEAVQLSENLKVALDAITKNLTQAGIKVIISGGDDLLIEYNELEHDMNFVEHTRERYREFTGMSMSCGIGASLAESINNLRLAKLYGKNQTKGAR